MKKLILLVALISTMSAKQVYAQTEVERPLGDFSSILIQYNVEAELFKGTSNKVVLTISGIKENKVISDIEDGQLILGFKSDKNLENVTVKAKIYTSGKIGAVEVNFSSSLDAQDALFASDLAVRVTESSSMKLNVNTTTLKVNLTSSSKLDLTAKVESADISISNSGKAQVKIEAKSLDATVASKGRLDITGTVDSQKINSNSSAKYMAYGLKSKSLVAQAHGNGWAEVTVTESILANVVSGGKIYYKGDPADVKVNATSSGIVEKVKE